MKITESTAAKTDRIGLLNSIDKSYTKFTDTTGDCG